MQHALRKHKKYAASSAPRFFRCPGSIRLSEGLPNVSSEYAKDGTEAHELLDYALRHKIRTSERAMHFFAPKWGNSIDQGALNERFDAVQVCLDFVYGILDLYPDAVLYNEAQYEVDIAEAPGEVGGTTDICIYIPSLKWVYIIDYKHGAGVPIEAEQNEQLLMYALGAYEAYKWDVDYFSICVVQPRISHSGGPVRIWDITHNAVWDYYSFNLRAVIAQCERRDAPLVPGDKQCKFCPAKAVCPAREAQAIQGAQGLVTTFREPPAKIDVKTLDVERLSQIWANREAIRGVLDATEEYIKSLVLSGTHVPGAKVVEVNAKRRYEGDATAVAEKLVTLTDLSLDAVFPRKLAGITEMEKAVIKKFRKGLGDTNKAAQAGKEAMAQLTTKSSSGNLVLVDETDPRPAVNRAARDFGNVKVIEHDG